MKKLEENKFDADFGIFDVCQICESVNKFTEVLNEDYNALSKDIKKFVKNFPDVRKHIEEFTKLAYVITSKSVDGRIAPTDKVKRLQSATQRLVLLVGYFVEEVDNFIDRLYESEAFDNFSEDEADELSSLACGLSLSFNTFRSWVRKL